MEEPSVVCFDTPQAKSLTSQQRASRTSIRKSKSRSRDKRRRESSSSSTNGSNNKYNSSRHLRQRKRMRLQNRGADNKLRCSRDKPGSKEERGRRQERGRFTHQGRSPARNQLLERGRAYEPGRRCPTETSRSRSRSLILGQRLEQGQSFKPGRRSFHGNNSSSSGGSARDECLDKGRRSDLFRRSTSGEKRNGRQYSPPDRMSIRPGLSGECSANLMNVPLQLDHMRNTHTHNISRTGTTNIHNNDCNSSQTDLNRLINVLTTAFTQNNSEKFHSTINAIPEFDPSLKNQSMNMWLTKVNDCAKMYGWTDRQTIHFSLPKLAGMAKRWYESLPSVLFSWQKWQVKLEDAFPCRENYGQMLYDMISKRARFGDSMEEYFYDKSILLNRCGIHGRNAVDCIIFGIDDRTVRMGAEAAQYDDPNKLLSYLRNVKVSNRVDKTNPSNTYYYSRQSSDKKMTEKCNMASVLCFNCGRSGHYSSRCDQPIKKCSKCNKMGHLSDACHQDLNNTKSNLNNNDDDYGK